MTNVLRDAKFGLRLLRRNPGFAAVAVLALALGISANTAIFSVIYATYLAPLPLRDPDRLVMVWTRMHGGRNSTAPADFVEWKRQADVFEELTAWSGRGVTLGTSDVPEYVQVGVTTPSLLRMMGYGYPFALGRDFLDEEGSVGRDRVVILSNQLWRERFGADPRIVGRSVRIDEAPYTVIGVLAPGPGDRHQYRMWLPLAFSPDQVTHDNHWLTVMGRLKPGVTIEQATANMSAVAQNLAREFPASNARKTVSVEPFRNNFVADSTKSALWLLVGAVALVLLIACANVANLLLARGTVRQRELAVRASLGASRAQVTRQLITESVVLAVIGGAFGVVLAFILVDVIVSILPPYTLPTEADVRVNVPVLLFTIAACGISGMLSGSAPAWQAARADLNEALKETGRSNAGGRHGLRRALVALEFALALTLLTAGGLAIQSFFRLANVDLGFNSDRVLTFSLPVRREKLPDAERMIVFYEQAIDRLRTVPGVTSVSVSTGLPADGGGGTRFSIAGQPVTDPAAQPITRARIVSPDYFKTFEVRVVHGRSFVDRDRAGAQPVTMVNETFVKRFLQGADPLTQRIVVERIAPFRPTRGPAIEWQIVGVYQDVANGGLKNPQQPEINLPFWQSPLPYASFAVRTAGDPAGVRQSIAAVIQSIDPNLAMANVKPMAQIVSELIAGDRFNSVLFGAFAGVALLLAAVGVYGVMSFVVAQRTHEIGLRVALGAAQGRVLAQMMREGMTPALLGTVIGSAGAYVVARSMQGLVYGVNVMDPTTFVVVALTLLAAAVLACLLPARRAASVDPMTALRKG